MSALIHILGADIPHHNVTVLQFFNDQLAATSEQARQFMLVTPLADVAARFPALTIRCYASQKSLADAVIACGRADRRQRFLLHGQFNRYLWLALLSGRLPGAQVSWHVWGADLYEAAQGVTYWLFYRLRRLAQRRIQRIFATRGDLHYVARRYPRIRGELLYFPAKMPALAASDNAADNAAYDATEDAADKATLFAADKDKQPLTLLVGNSGDRSNQHIAALHAIHQQWGGDKIKIIVPMGYPPGNDAYIRQVEQTASALFVAENVTVLRETLAFDDYWRLLRRCDMGYFLFARQQGIGTLCLLIQANVPCVLNRDNPFWRDMQEQRLPVLFSDQTVSWSAIHRAQQQLRQMDKSRIAFFRPGYLPLWQQALICAAGEPL